MPKPELVRVKDKSTKHEYSLPASAVDPEAHTVLKGQDARALDGSILPPKHHESLSSSGTKAATSGQQADTKKEKD